MTRERFAFFFALFFCVVLVSAVTTIRVLEEAQEARAKIISK